MKKSLLHIISIIFPRKLIFVLFVLFIVNCSLLTVNCLSQWVQQSVPVNKPINGIKFIDSLKGWACAGSTSSFDTCYILHTSNSGTNWIVQYVSPNSLYLAISVVDSNIIYVGGGDLASTANLTKSTNGGLNWTIIPTPTNMSILDMQFLNKDSGWTCGASVGADVRTTTNGGLNWTVRTTGIASQTQRIFFLNYNTGFCAANSFLYKTTNAGLNWNLLNSFGHQVGSVFFLNANIGWVTVASSAQEIQYTTNGGTNWSTQNLFPYTPTNVIFLNNSTGYATIGYLHIAKTVNSGLNWGYQMDTLGSDVMSFVDTSNGWAGYSNGSISHTSNGGGQIIYTGLINYGSEIPKKYLLYQNYPNPFNPSTTIKVDLPKASNISLVICDMLGRELYKITNQYLKAGSYIFNWDARKYSSGIYFYRLIAENNIETKKMILIK